MGKEGVSFVFSELEVRKITQSLKLKANSLKLRAWF